MKVYNTFPMIEGISERCMHFLQFVLTCFHYRSVSKYYQFFISYSCGDLAFLVL